ncbi:uncharacterized protein LOC105396758 [Plutella xylostella]|uniref:uncharacterized protein LOC105396758 n=1 Tax=Plutella xylostella TaxID=51655 RepID=UPI002032238B|nr:uncharacterized protein LOC105396758 [Plutella xylostella]
MSEEMAVTDTGSGEEAKLNGDEAAAASATGATEASVEPTTQTPQDPAEGSTSQPTDKPEMKEAEESEEAGPRKRRASSAFSDDANTDFRGFDKSNLDDSTVEYNRVLERMEAEVSAASEALVPVRSVVATPTGVTRVSKRLRQDTGTDGSRPSSALSSRSDGEGVSTDLPPPATTVVPVVLASSAASSPAHRGARRATTEMSSPLLRVPLERGWRRELVYRAALDSHSRRNADIYYYMPSGKKLRSTREVTENLSGTGLTLENFSFFKEPLGVDDPEKEIIRDAKMIRKSEVAPPPAPAPVEGKRTPKPKPPKGASPEPPSVKSPPAKIRVKSMGARLSSGGATTPTTQKPPPKKQEKPAPSSADNNNTTWKKPSSDAPATSPAPGAAGGVAPGGVAPPPRPPPAPARPPPPPLQSRPEVMTSPETHRQPSPLVQQPCSIQCGGGRVPSLACAMCLCLYHPACANHPVDNDPAFLCKNCLKCGSPPPEPPPLAHKPAPRRAEPPASPLTITMKVQGSDAGGQRVWAVKPTTGAATVTAGAAITAGGAGAVPGGAAAARALALRPTLPQSLAVFNGRRFIVVPRNIQAPNHSDAKAKAKVSNGAPAAAPRRRTRAKADDTDHFTDFYNLSKEKNYNIVTQVFSSVSCQIFQYLGMRDLAACARVCRLWRSLAHAPPLWRHVRMKNSHVSDWAGLCANLQRHGTTRLDLRKMLLPQNDDAFWQAFATHIPTVTTIERIELCRCPASAVEAVCKLRSLRSLSALAVRDARLDPWPLADLAQLHELRCVLIITSTTGAGGALTPGRWQTWRSCTSSGVSLSSSPALQEQWRRLDPWPLADLAQLHELSGGASTPGRWQTWRSCTSSVVSSSSPALQEQWRRLDPWPLADLAQLHELRCVLIITSTTGAVEAPRPLAAGRPGAAARAQVCPHHHQHYRSSGGASTPGRWQTWRSCTSSGVSSSSPALQEQWRRLDPWPLADLAQLHELRCVLIITSTTGAVEAPRPLAAGRPGAAARAQVCPHHHQHYRSSGGASTPGRWQTSPSCTSSGASSSSPALQEQWRRLDPWPLADLAQLHELRCVLIITSTTGAVEAPRPLAAGRPGAAARAQVCPHHHQHYRSSGGASTPGRWQTWRSCTSSGASSSSPALQEQWRRLDPWPLADLAQLHELRLKSMTGLSLTRDLSPLAKLSHLQHLSLTSIKELGIWSCEIVGSLKQLVSLELGECTFGARFGAALRGLTRLTRLRLERGTADCAAPALLRALAQLPRLTTMELVNFDVKVGFDDALAECKNIQRLLIIPTYVSQSATTNKQVLSGVLRLKDTLTHLMWGVTIELLRVTELFIDQCDQGGDSKKKDIGECIPVLKPVPGCRLPDEHQPVAGPPQVEILPLPTLQRLLSAQLPNTKLKILRIPFHATWRQSLADFQ